MKLSSPPLSDSFRIVRVFIASPSDLGSERRLARIAVDEINRTIARPLGFHVDLIGWEDTLSAAGRPQEIINEELRTCHMFVGLLWARWGTPPDTTGLYTSGFEEEFSIAARMHEASFVPYIRMFFKDVDPAQLDDPGPELSKVLAFKKSIIDAKRILFDTFDQPEMFAQKMRFCLADYIHRLDSTLQERSKTSSKEASLTLADSENTAPDEEGAPQASLEADFLTQLADRVRSPSHSRVTNVDVARVRNLGFALGGAGNDEQTLQAHDANLIYRFRNSLEFSSRELSSLADAGLNALDNENTPTWSWVADRLTAIAPWLALSTVLGSDSFRIGAFRVMTLLGEGIPVGPAIDNREEFIRSWFSDAATSRVKVAALGYLGEVGVISDLVIIKEEISRGDISTAKAALEAAIRLLHRHSAKDATTFAIDNSFDELGPEAMELAVLGISTVSIPLLSRALDHRSPELRAAAVSELSRQRALPPLQLATASRDTASIVREAAFEIMRHEGRVLSVDEAKSILIRDEGGTGALFSSKPSNARGLELLEAFELEVLERLSSKELRAAAREAAAGSQKAYFALCRGHFSKMAANLRRNVDDRFSRFYNDYIAAYRAKYNGVPGLEDLIKVLEDGRAVTIERWLRQGLNILVDKGGKADLGRLRKALDGDYVSPCVADIKFFGAYGKLADIPRISRIALDYRTGGGRGGAAASILTYQPPLKLAASAALSLLNDDIRPILKLDIDPSLLSSVIAESSPSQFKSIGYKATHDLLRHPRDKVRKAVALKIILSETRSIARKHLREYVDSEEDRFYNVIFWLDLAEAFTLSKARRVAAKAISAVVTR